MPASAGLHHVAAICRDPAQALEFYTKTLGLRLVKRTVDADEPGSWRLYFGDETGTPGSILTFVADPNGTQGTPGAGQAVSIAFAIPPGSAIFWAERLADHDMDVAITNTALAFHDPDGLALELVEEAGAAALPHGHSSDAEIAEHAPRGISGVTLLVSDAVATARVLTRGLGWTESGRATHADYTRLRFIAPGKPPIGGNIDLLTRPGLALGHDGAGCVHHIAFRARDDAEQTQFAAAARGLGLIPTAALDRSYFQSVYFREPSGVLLEVATDGPGFLIDEPRETLGEALKLPPRLEGIRAEIKSGLEPLE